MIKIVEKKRSKDVWILGNSCLPAGRGIYLELGIGDWKIGHYLIIGAWLLVIYVQYTRWLF